MPSGHHSPVPAAAAVLLAASALLLAGCNSSGSSSPQATVTVTAPASSPGSGVGSGGGSSTPPTSATGRPGIVAVTTAGALVMLNSATGAVTSTLVPSDVIDDEVSVSGSTVYFTEGAGCNAEVESVTTSGGDLTAIAAGQLPAISPDGTKLAFTTEPVMSETCVPDPAQASVAAKYKIVIRTLSSGAQQDLTLPAQVRRSQLLPPVSHLSWSADGTKLAVSTSAVADNEGWTLYIVDLGVAKYYVGPGAGVTYVPVTGAPTAERSYIREGIFLPDGDLFISRACCGGVPIRNTSRLMWEVSPDGALVHQVAIGYPTLDHVSLSADSTGQWLLYVGGNDLYVSQNGNRPTELTGGLVAAAWM
jgi:WD40-like Beta Propeller Repeat